MKLSRKLVSEVTVSGDVPPVMVSPMLLRRRTLQNVDAEKRKKDKADKASRKSVVDSIIEVLQKDVIPSDVTVVSNPPPATPTEGTPSKATTQPEPEAAPAPEPKPEEPVSDDKYKDLSPMMRLAMRHRESSNMVLNRVGSAQVESQKLKSPAIPENLAAPTPTEPEAKPIMTEAMMQSYGLMPPNRSVASQPSELETSLTQQAALAQVVESALTPGVEMPAPKLGDGKKISAAFHRFMPRQ